MLNNKTIPGVFLALTSLLFSGCSSEVATPKSGTNKKTAEAALPEALFVSAAPSQSTGVKKIRSTAKVGDTVVVRGIIGGRKKAFLEDRAVMLLTDATLSPCPPEEGCPTPWDFCCETKDTLLANTLTVQVVDAKGSPLKLSLDGSHGLAGTKTVVVEGLVSSTEGGVVIDATKIHLEKS